MTPGRKFSTMTSADRTRRPATAASVADFRSRTMLFLPRFQVAFAGVFQTGPPGGSTRITSAPWSPSIMLVSGPAMYCPKSITRTPSSAPAILHLSPPNLCVP